MPASRRFLGSSLAALPAVVLGACITTAPTGYHRVTDGPGAGGSGGGTVLGLGGSSTTGAPDSGLSNDPHAVIGAEPSHGPFNGGQRVLIHGKGFSSKARVWFGAAEVDPATLLPIDPSRVQVSAPPSKAGLVDVTVQDGADASTKRTLAGGYTYDALFAEPSTGPVPGGTVIEIIGQNTGWNASSVAAIDGVPCTTLTLRSPTLLSCTVPKGTPGSKAVSVKTGKESLIVLDAYTYADTNNGYKGGLSGLPLAGALKALVYDNVVGNPIAGAHVVVGSSLAGSLQAQTDANGVAVFNDASLTAPRTVTVAARCFSPITFVSNPVDTVTVYLDPVLTPACASSGDPPPVGGKPEDFGEIQGELVWETIKEYERGPWNNVPAALGPHQRQAAFVFVSSGSPKQPFQLPPDSTAVLPSTPGNLGYAFDISTYAGNTDLYALAGVEDTFKSPPEFTAYVMGVVKGVPVLPTMLTTQVYLSMTIPLDQAVTMTVAPPAPGPKGPDRLLATSAVMLGNSSFAILPSGAKSPLLPVQGSLSFVGMPPLDAALSGDVYWSTASAVTGAVAQAPMSVVAKVLTTAASQVVAINDFVPIPVLTTPASGAAWDGRHLAASFTGGGPIDLCVYDIGSGNGLAHWKIAVPELTSSNAIEVPDLSGFPLASLPPGPVTITVTGGRIPGFDYGLVGYRQLVPSGMAAYSIDSFNAHL